MLHQRAQLVGAMSRIVDVGVLIVSAVAAYHLRVWIYSPLSDWPEYVPVFGLMIAVWSVLLYWFEAHEAPVRPGMVCDVIRLLKVSVVGFLLAGAVIFAVRGHFISRLLVGVYAVVAFFFMLAGRCVLRFVLARTTFPERRVIVVADGPRADEIRAIVERERRRGVYVVDVVGRRALAARRADDPAAALSDLLSTTVVDEVIFDLNSFDMVRLTDLLLVCERLGVIAHVTFDLGGMKITRTPPPDLHGLPLLTFATIPHDERLLLVKRVFDIAVSAALLVLLSPVLALVALAVKLSSPGPLLFRQVRAGEHGRRFTIYKFRSMVANAESLQPALVGANEMTGPVFKIRADPRLTRIGRVLRRTSLDELPQLWNVLKGEMSIVGPRPAVPSEVARYESWQRRRLSMKPGLTCLWQVSGRSSIAFDRWMRLDLEYIETWSLGLDLRILIRTIPAVLTGRGAS